MRARIGRSGWPGPGTGTCHSFDSSALPWGLPVLHVLLHEPEIPPNTGNVIRLCANAGCRLHLIEPLGFELDDARLRRAGLDYHEYTRVEVHADLDAWRRRHGRTSADGTEGAPRRLFAFSTRGRVRHDQVAWQMGDALLFGAETRGLPDPVLATIDPQQLVRLPMQPGGRSLNLSNAVAIAVYEAWRQLDFAGDRQR